MSSALASIRGVGLACPLGLTSRAALAAMRAGISRFREVDDFVGPGGSVRACMLAQLGSDRARTERAAELARHALTEAVAGLDPADALPCFLALPEPDVGPRIDLDGLLDRLAEVRAGASAPVPLDVRPDRIVAAGRAGVFAALERALALLSGGQEQFALIGGVDSLVDPETLDALAEQDRLLGRTNLDGIIPGEAAAFLLLSRPVPAERRRAPAQLAAIAMAHEPLPFAKKCDRLSAAEGLAAAFRRLRAAVPDRVERVYAGATGESYFGREFAHAYLRNAPLMPEPLRCEPVSDALGDLGAAAGAVCLVQAASRPGAGPALVYASSDSGLVGAAAVAQLRP